MVIFNSYVELPEGIASKSIQYGYGSIPVNTIFRGMNIHLPTILMFTRGTRFWRTAIYHPIYPINIGDCQNPWTVTKIASWLMIWSSLWWFNHHWSWVLIIKHMGIQLIKHSRWKDLAGCRPWIIGILWGFNDKILSSDPNSCWLTIIT